MRGDCRTLFLLAAMAGATIAGPRPVIGSVLNFATQDTRLSPGSLARISGANLAASPPLVMVAGPPARYRSLLTGDDAFSNHFDIELPMEVPLGPALLTVATSDGISDPSPVVIERFAPGLVYPSLRRSPSPDGEPVQFFNGRAGLDVAHPGEILYAFATGLGPAEPFTTRTFAPPVKTLAGIIIRIGGTAAEVVETVFLPDRGVYRVGFRVPLVSGVLPLAVEVGSRSVVAMLVPVGDTPFVAPFSLGIGRAAPDAIVGNGICGPNELRGDPLNPPLEVGGVMVRVTDSAGVVRLAPILCATGYSASYVLPHETSLGPAQVSALYQGAEILTGYLDVRPISQAMPGFSPLFTGYAVRIREGVASVEPAYRLCRNGWWCFSLDAGPEGDDLYVVMITTGIRNRTSLASVRVLLGGILAPVTYAGPQSELAGLDQINFKVPRSLAGRGTLVMQIVVNGVPDNTFYSDSFLGIELH